jgi:hypothetical protein
MILVEGIFQMIFFSGLSQFPPMEDFSMEAAKDVPEIDDESIKASKSKRRKLFDESHSPQPDDRKGVENVSESVAHVGATLKGPDVTMSAVREMDGDNDDIDFEGLMPRSRKRRRRISSSDDDDDADDNVVKSTQELEEELKRLKVPKAVIPANVNFFQLIKTG